MTDTTAQTAPAYFTTGQAAGRLGVSERTVQRLIHEGTLVATRPRGGRGRYVIAPADLEALVAASRTTGAAAQQVTA